MNHYFKTAQKDVFLDKYDGDESQKDKFVKDLFNKLYESWNINVENLKQIISKFSFDMEKLEVLREAFKKINIIKKDSKKDSNIIDEDEDETIQTGKKQENYLH